MAESAGRGCEHTPVCCRQCRELRAELLLPGVLIIDDLVDADRPADHLERLHAWYEEVKRLRPHLFK